MRRARPAVAVGQPAAAAETRPSWSSPRQALAVVTYRPHLRQTIRVALVVGTVLFAINQLDVVLRHQATVATWLKGALTYLVPFCVANYGILVATRLTGKRSR
jgi:hypothetical protein